MPKVSIIGAGNVAWTFGKRFKEQGWEVKAVYNRDIQSAKTLAKAIDAEAIDNLDAISQDLDLIFIAVADDAIAEVAQQIGQSPALVLHCSGSSPLAALPHKHRGVVWPLRSISKHQSTSWSDMNIVVEADTDIARVRCLDLISSLGAKAVQMSSEERKISHLVAVILNNFSNHLLHMADVLCEGEGLDRRIFQDLMAHTLEYSGPAKLSQTGPAARNDQEVMKRQLALLEEHPHFRSVYEQLSASIIATRNEEEL